MQQIYSKHLGKIPDTLAPYHISNSILVPTEIIMGESKKEMVLKKIYTGQKAENQRTAGNPHSSAAILSL